MSAASVAFVPDYPSLEKSRAMQYGLVLTIMLAFAAAVIAAFDYVVDPFQHYRKPSWYEPRFYRALQRQINPGIARHYEYDTVITGSSMMENYSNREAGRILGGNVVDLAMGAATAYELKHLLSTLAAAGKMRHVIFDLNYNAFSGPVNAQVVDEPLPLHLYDDNRWNDLRYLLHQRTLGRSLEIALGLPRGRYSTDADRPWYWADEYEFSRAAVLRGLDLRNINRDFKQSPRTLEGMLASFETNLLPVLRTHPEVRFSLVYPPYSALVWKDFRQRNQVEVTLAFRRRVFELVRPLLNVVLYDFQTRRDWVTNLDNYKDIYHFSPAVSRAMIESIAAGTDRVGDQGIAASEALLRELAAAPGVESDPVR